MAPSSLFNCTANIFAHKIEEKNNTLIWDVTYGSINMQCNNNVLVFEINNAFFFGITICSKQCDCYIFSIYNFFYIIIFIYIYIKC